MDGDPSKTASMTANVLKPTTVDQCHLVIESLAAQIATLQEQVALLQERVTLNSRNSSKPPSSDGPGSGNRAQRRASTRARGAQKGHPGSYRALLDEAQVEAVHDCPPPQTCECGGSVSAVGKPLRHQVFDLPAQIRPDSRNTACTAGYAPIAGEFTARHCPQACRAVRSGRAHWRWWACWARTTTSPSSRSATCWLG